MRMMPGSMSRYDRKRTRQQAALRRWRERRAEYFQKNRAAYYQAYSDVKASVRDLSRRLRSMSPEEFEAEIGRRAAFNRSIGMTGDRSMEEARQTLTMLRRAAAADGRPSAGEHAGTGSEEDTYAPD